MIRVPGIRTGVEIWADEGVGLVPLDTPDRRTAVEGLADLGLLGSLQFEDDRVVNPYLAVHTIRAVGGADSGQPPLGQLVLCSPSAQDDWSALDEAATSEPALAEIARYVFFGLEPDQEAWVWFGTPWPPTFELRAEDWPIEAQTGATVEIYPQGRFVDSAVSLPVGGKQYWISNDTPRAGILQVTASQQRWLGRRRSLVDRLLPPDRHGIWRFETPGASSAVDPGDYFELTLAKVAP